MKLQNFLSFIILFLLFTTSLYSVEKTQAISLKSAIVFNTLCAKCHEGQCSGRLSFDTGSESATNHIKRYVDDIEISKLEVKEYFTLLNYMKKKCLLFMPDDVKWDINNFSDFAIVSHKRYFFPLGKLKSGKYTLHIQTEEDINFTFEVISSKFDSFLNQSVCSCTEEKVFNFVLEENTNYFLRIHSKKPLHLKNLKLSPHI